MDKYISLMRHCNASPHMPETEDINRTLSETGLIEAEKSASYFANKQVDFVLCSPATRTKITYEIIKPALIDSHKYSEEKAIYKNGAKEILNLIKVSPSESSHILIIGHNPTIFNLAILLADHEAHDIEISGMKTGQIITFKVNLKNWIDIDSCEKKVTNIFIP